jgi:hypothetical protein
MICCEWGQGLPAGAQIFYGEFDGHRLRRVLIKVIGE